MSIIVTCSFPAASIYVSRCHLSVFDKAEVGTRFKNAMI